MKSKQQLQLRALLPPFPPTAVTLLAQEMPPDQDPAKRLRELLAELCNFLHEALPGFFLLHTAGVLPMHKVKADTMDVVMRQALCAWLKKARIGAVTVRAGPAAHADAIIGAMEARFLHAYLLKRVYSDAQNRAFIRGLLQAVLQIPVAQHRSRKGESTPGRRPSGANPI